MASVIRVQDASNARPFRQTRKMVVGRTHTTSPQRHIAARLHE